MAEKEGTVFTLGKDTTGKYAVQQQKRISEIARDMRGTGTGSHEEDWAENIKQTSGYLLDGVEETLQVVSGAYRHRERTGRKDQEDAVEPVAVDLVKSRMARFLSRHANLMDGARVQPATDDPVDEKQAKAATRTVEAMWLNGWEQFVMRNMVNMLNCERSYGLIEGDPNLYMEVTDSGVETNGGIIKKALTPLSVDVMPFEGHSIHDADAIVIRENMTAEELYRRWKIEPKDDNNWEPGEYEHTLLTELHPMIGKTTYKTKRLFIKPSIRRPYGEQHIILGDQVEHSVRVDPADKDSPLSIGTWDYKYPVSEFVDIPLDFGFHGRGRQTAARTVIKILCANWSRMVQASGGMPAITIDADPDVDKEALANLTYLFLERGATGKPIGFNVIPDLPLHKSIMEWAIRFLDEIYAQSPPSRGQLPGSRTSGRAVEALIQQDMLADTPTGKLVLTGIRETMRRALGEGLRVWSDPHIESILGEGREAERIALKTGSLKPGWDIFIVPGNGRPRPQSEVRQEINESVQHGVLTPAQGRKLAKYYVEEDVFDPKRHQERIVDMEEAEFVKGFYVPTNPYDDHAYHLEEHNTHRARRHGNAGAMEKMQAQRHQAEHQEKLGNENRAALADQVAKEMQAHMQEIAQRQALGIPGPGPGKGAGGAPAAPPGPPAAVTGAPQAA
jgi:hypothetical protein